MNKQPRKNLAESVLARAELFRRGMMFEGVPQFSATELEMPAPMDAGGASAAADATAAPQGQAAPPVPGMTAPLVSGAVTGETPLETLLEP